jgi:hypothetical protein
MKRLTLLLTGVVLLAALCAAVSDTATGSRPLGHVVGDFTAERMGFAFVGGPLVRLGTVTISVNAFDRTLELPFPTAPSSDTGTITETVDGTSTTYQVANVLIEGDTAFMFTDSLFFYVFHDGGVPGNEIVGPPNSVGLLPTRDSYEQFGFIGSQHITGFVTSGNIKISSITS